MLDRTSRELYSKMRQEYGKNDCLWCKYEIITKWANYSWRFRMENPFEGEISSSGEYKPLSLFLKQRDRLSALHPDMSDSMISMKILRKFSVQLDHAMRCRFLELFSTEEYINAMEGRSGQT
ncbi:hypothetical protein O181_013544 [Austropuccinia psidii MF-1]|uniref:Uncharacterized protein n=1 Tax=Austropuccinia psidii MF-1 TaxID=1389203 RepID=A0A9Q3GNY9_9BASI|nr:hypothetical protein [Austropuccinia psidii MF-1]